MQQLVKNMVSGLTIDSDCSDDQQLTKHYRYLLSFANSRIEDREVARDLVQETFLIALEHKNSFQNRSSEQTWLVAILKNKITDHYRKKYTEARHLALPNPVISYEMFNNHHDLLPVLHKAIQKLPELWQKVFTMKHFDDQPTPDICRQLQLTTANYWVISHRTRSKLKVSLQNYL